MKKVIIKLPKDFIFETSGRKQSLNSFLAKFDVRDYRFKAPKNTNEPITISEKYWIDVFNEVRKETGKDFIEATFGKKMNVQDAVEHLNPIVFYKGTIQKEVYLGRIVMG